MKAVSVNELSKSYPTVKAINELRFDVDRGTVFGIIGPDGAGKTTLFRILTTLTLADKGKALVEGMDVVKDYRNIRPVIGYMPGKFSLYQDLTVEENLRFFATVFHTTVQTNYHLIEDIYTRIEPFKKRKAGQLSGGMKQKLALCCALIHKPRVLFLDEPTTGVDPVSRKEFWDMLLRLKKQGISILVSTPYMDEARRCDRIALMQEGRFLKIDTPEGIINDYPDSLWTVRSNRIHRLLIDLRGYHGVKSSFSFGENIHVTLQKHDTIDNLQRYLAKIGHSQVEIKAIRPTVEDCFMSLLKVKEEK